MKHYSKTPSDFLLLSCCFAFSLLFSILSDRDTSPLVFYPYSFSQPPSYYFLPFESVFLVFYHSHTNQPLILPFGGGLLCRLDPALPLS